MALDYIPRSDDLLFGRLGQQTRFTPQSPGRPVGTAETYYGQGAIQPTVQQPGMTIGQATAPFIGQLANQDLNRDLPQGPGGPINVNRGAARGLYEEYQNYVADEIDAGLGFLPPAAPVMAFDTQRDPVTGDYLGYEAEANYSGVPGPVRAMQEMYLRPALGRLNATIPETNEDRLAVQQAAQPVEYTSPRTQQIFNPGTGQSSYRTIHERQYAPFLNPASQYAQG